MPEDEYEYNIETTDDEGEKTIYYQWWEPHTDWLKRQLAELIQWDKDADTGYSRRMVKRRKAGPTEAA